MSRDPRDTPVVLLIYNRPAHTAKVFEALATVQPRTLLVVADGPRSDRADDTAQVGAARAVIERVDWPCQVLTNYAPVNLGCRRRVASGLTWAFETVEEAIVLEDDCVPHPTFFRFCTKLLDRYRDDERVMTIDGFCALPMHARPPHSYFFSQNVGSWGWASWRRAWRHFDMNMASWPSFRDQGWLRAIADTPQEADFWTSRFDAVHAGLKDSWAFAWRYACWANSGLSARSAVSLVRNIGFGAEATHTRLPHPYAAVTLEGLEELVHPPFVVRDKYRDRAMFVDWLCGVSDTTLAATSASEAPVSADEYGRLVRRVRALEEKLVAVHTDAGRRRAEMLAQGRMDPSHRSPLLRRWLGCLKRAWAGQ